MKLSTDNFIEAHGRLADALAGGQQSWLAERRARALDALAKVGLPTLRHEDWKYTDIRPLTARDYEFAGIGEDTVPAVGIPDVEGLETAGRIVFVNGRFAPGLSALDQLPGGVAIGSLAAAIANHPDEVRARLGRAMPEGSHGFGALNDAFVNDGLFIHLDAGAAVDLPVEVVFATTDGDAAPLVQPRNLVLLGEGARLNLVERTVGAGETPYLNNMVCEVFLDGDARLEYVKLQEDGERGGSIAGLFVRQRAGSSAVVNTVSLGGMLLRNDIRVYLDEAGAECALNGLALGSGRQHIDNHTTIEHVAGECVSREFYKSVLDGRARSVFHGRIIVHQDAQKTDSEQRNENLLLSRDAEVDTKPQLEIYADDVKCSHGATVGQLDEDAVFYLRSRGIDEAEARALLTIAFADAAVAPVTSDALRAYIDRRIRARLGHDALAAD